MPSGFLADNNAFRNWLAAKAAGLGLEDAACVRLDSPSFLAALEGFSARYSPSELEGMPRYVSEARPVKADLRRHAPWAKSAIVGTASFRALPPASTASLFKLADPQSPVSGLVAGYELRQDYHKFGLEAMRSLGSSLAVESGLEPRLEAFCDSNPLPERGLALYAGLGTLGFHRCLLSSATDSGVFCASLLTDLALPEILTEAPSPRCNRCGACVTACPNSVLGELERPFDCSRCVAALCSETRGPLDLEQARLLGRWVSGCGECLRDCHSSKMPPPVSIDLEWLLLCPASELARAIEGSSLSHAGPTLLRRNALAVLSNRGAPESLALVAKFKGSTGSAMLRSFSEALLNQAVR